MSRYFTNGAPRVGMLPRHEAEFRTLSDAAITDVRETIEPRKLDEFVAIITGRPKACDPQKLDEFVAAITGRPKPIPRHELDEFAAAITGRPKPCDPRKLDAFVAAITDRPDPNRLCEVEAFLAAITGVSEGGWDPADHPRKGYPPDGGEFVDKDGSGGGANGPASGNLLAMGGPSQGGAKRQSAIPLNPSDPSHWYLPSEDKGTWLGKTGDSAFSLKTPIKVNGKLVHEIQFTKGLPILDKFILPGKSVAVILTGDSDTDIRNAKVACQKANPGKPFPRNATFHHDLLHAAEYTTVIDGKKTNVLVGKMHLVPTDVNRAVFHQGSASVATKYYQAIDANIKSITKLAKEEAAITGRAGTVVARAVREIKPGKVAKGIASLVGRSVVRAIPIFTTGLALLEFSDNVEAHGLGGAVARATPVLGDLIAVHDIGSDLAKQILDDANAAATAHLQRLNASAHEAWDKANDQTIAAYNELAPQIQVTNRLLTTGGSLVDPDDIAEALNIYRNQMQQANYMRAEKGKSYDFDAISAGAKQELRTRLERASQKNAEPQSRPMA